MQKAEQVFNQLAAHREALAEAIGDLIDIQSEYQEWADNLPENLSSSAISDKLEEITSIDLESARNTAESLGDDIEEIISEAAGVELPLGFGRD